MKQFIVLAAVVAVVAAGQGGDVDDALLARVAQILGGSSGGSSGGGSFGGGSFGGQSGGSSGYVSRQPSSGYGAPSDFGRSGSGGGSSSGVQIGTPERAQRVAEFELSGGSRGGGSSRGPSSSYGAPPSNEYGAPGGGGAIGVARGGGGGGGVDLGRPERAQRVAEFSLGGGSSGGSSFRSGGGSSGGY